MNPSHPALLTALIGDLIGSRDLPRDRRAEVQVELEGLLECFNRTHRAAISSQFVLTTGDEFQGLLRAAHVIPDIVWELHTALRGVHVRLGVGFGELDTPLRPQAIGMDGPVFHEARRALERAEKSGWEGGVFAGFGEDDDAIMNGMARLLESHRARMTERQRAVATLLRPSTPQVDVARQLGITKQAVNDHVQAMHWEAYREGEAAWRTALRRFTAPRESA